MEALKPDLEVIDGICYRVNPGNHGSYLGKSEDLHYEEDDSVVQEIEDVILDKEDYEEVDGGRFKLSFHVAKIYFSYIIGSKGATKKRLEIETKTRISIPKPGLDGNIVVTGPDKRSVSSAKNRILMMVASSRRRQSLTHFISIPFNSLSFKNGFATFKEDVLNNCKGRGIDESIFQTPEKLHMTVCLFVLGDDVERKQAAAALQGCKEEVISSLLPSNRPLKIQMCGVDYMNDDPTEIQILYGKVMSSEDDPDLLQRVCDGIINYFAKRDLIIIEKAREQLKMHVTLMNTHFRTKGSLEGRKRRETFDGSQIISTFDNFFFGSDFVTEIDLSIMGSYGKNGYYQASSQITLP